VPNANANTANAISTSFFAMSIPLVVWRIEPSDQCEVAKENDGHSNCSKAERKGRLKTASSFSLQMELS
jgi:hypothetical protein